MSQTVTGKCEVLKTYTTRQRILKTHPPCTTLNCVPHEPQGLKEPQAKEHRTKQEDGKTVF